MIHRATASFPCQTERAGPWQGTAMRLHPLGSHPCPPGGDSGKHSTLTSNSHCENPRPFHSQDLPRQLKGIRELQSCSKAPPWGPPARSWGVLGLPSPSTNRLAPFLGKTPLQSQPPSRKHGFLHVTRLHTRVHTWTPSRDSDIRAASTLSGTIPPVSSTTFPLPSTIPCLPSPSGSPARCHGLSWSRQAGSGAEL